MAARSRTRLAVWWNEAARAVPVLGGRGPLSAPSAWRSWKPGGAILRDEFVLCDPRTF
jgi:hypothetical protein